MAQCTERGQYGVLTKIIEFWVTSCYVGLYMRYSITVMRFYRHTLQPVYVDSFAYAQCRWSGIKALSYYLTML